MNDLEKENAHLKQQLSECEEKKQNLKDLLLHSEPIVEQKKLQELIYKIVFDVIDEKIEKAEEQLEMTGDSWYLGQVDALKDLKKELEHD